MSRLLFPPILLISLAACQMTPPAPLAPTPLASEVQAAPAQFTENPPTALADTGAPLALTETADAAGLAEFNTQTLSPDIEGIWRIAGGTSNGCALRFDEAAASPASLSLLGCPASPLAIAGAWTASGDRVKLLSHDGQELALLFVDRPDLLTGYTADGEDLVLSR